MKSRITFTLFLVALIVSGAYAQCDQTQGQFSSLTGQTKNYSYCTGFGTLVSPIWIVTKGTIMSSSVSQDGTTAYASVRWDTPGTGNIKFRDGIILDNDNVTITCNTPGNPTLTSTPSRCGTGTVTLTATPGTNGNAVKWYNSSQVFIQQSSSYTTPSLSSNTTYYFSTYNTSSTCEGTKVQINVTINAVPSTATNVNNPTVCKGSTAEVSATPGSPGNTIRWFTASTGGTLLHTGTTYTTPTVTETKTYYAQSYNSTTGCFAATRTPVTVSIADPPFLPSGIADEVIYGSGSITIPASPLGGDQVKWYADTTGGTAFHTGSSYTTSTLSEPTAYYLSTFNSTLSCESESRTPVTITVLPITAPNAIITENIRVPGKTADSQLYTLTDLQKSKTVTYLDGSMRVYQNVAAKGSPDGFDVILPVKYDDQGRSSKSYLPYVSDSVNGSFRSAFESEQLAFYAASGDKIANDANPFSVVHLEASPLARPITAGGVGANFQPGTGHTREMAYSFNVVADSVRKFSTDGSSSGYYGANTLYKTIMINENGHQVISFTNELGRTVLSRKELDEVIEGQSVPWLDTYYLYDDLGRVKYTISPKGVAAMKAGGWNFSQSIQDQYVYEYVYDKRGRMTEKKVPGSAWSYFCYDDLDRQVLMQDGLLKNTNQWLFIKYDQKGRPVLQGLYSNGVNTTRSSLQAMLDTLYSASHPTYGENAWYEMRGTALEGYTNNSFPKTNQDNSSMLVLSVNYYDNHDFNNDGNADYAYVSQGLSGVSPQDGTVNETVPGNPYGLPTGSKRLVLGTSTWLYTYVFYDRNGRVIQVRSDNHLSPTKEDLVTSVYDFEGKLLTRKMYHKAGAGKETTVVNKYNYDDGGRLIKIYQNNNGAGQDQLVVKYEYNELGQLVDKKLHNTGGDNFIQSVDYRYTIRGQLESINNSKLTVDSRNDESNDFFGMELVYSDTVAGLNNTALYNGNISAIKWKGPGVGSGENEQRSYAYSFDKVNRLKSASFQASEGSAWTKECGTLNETMKYDHNGNIIALSRKENLRDLDVIEDEPVVTSVPQLMDSLTYTYSSSAGNNLAKVEDASSNEGGFKNGVSLSEEYFYDVNGNLIKDANKGIDSIAYNFLGKPMQINFADGKIIHYVYDAAGVKLSMYVVQNGDTIMTDYAGSFVYQNGELSFFGSPEGRVVKNGSNLEYQYAISDHQGNTRIVFTSVAPSPDERIATFEGGSGDDAGEYLNVDNVVTFNSANHTPGGSKVVQMNQNYKVGPAKSVMVYPGDTIHAEVGSYYESGSGYGTGSPAVAVLVSAVASAFGGISSGGGESGLIYDGIDAAFGAFGLGGNQGDDVPAAYLNYILFDQRYNVLDMGWKPVTSSSYFNKAVIAFDPIPIKEAGYIFVYLSYENESNAFVYFDDFKVNHTKGQIMQYNEYYPFGLQTQTSWTRNETTPNNYLYNGPTETNVTTGWNETMFRSYDPVLGRFMQVDPMASQFGSLTPYNYAANNPAVMNDPTGLYPRWYDEYKQWAAENLPPLDLFDREPGGSSTGWYGHSRLRGPGSMNHWSDHISRSPEAQQRRDYFLMGSVSFGAKYGVYGGDIAFRNGQMGHYVRESSTRYFVEGGIKYEEVTIGVEYRFVPLGQQQTGGEPGGPDPEFYYDALDGMVLNNGTVLSRNDVALTFNKASGNATYLGFRNGKHHVNFDIADFEITKGNVRALAIHEIFGHGIMGYGDKTNDHYKAYWTSIDSRYWSSTTDQYRTHTAEGLWLTWTRVGNYEGMPTKYMNVIYQYHPAFK